MSVPLTEAATRDCVVQNPVAAFPRPAMLETPPVSHLRASSSARSATPGSARRSHLLHFARSVVVAPPLLILVWWCRLFLQRRLRLSRGQLLFRPMHFAFTLPSRLLSVAEIDCPGVCTMGTDQAIAARFRRPCRRIGVAAPTWGSGPMSFSPSTTAPGKGAATIRAASQAAIERSPRTSALAVAPGCAARTETIHGALQDCGNLAAERSSGLK